MCLKMSMEIIKKAKYLPPEWDALCGDNYSLKKDFLIAVEKGNPCQQSYYLFKTAQGVLDSILMTYVGKRNNILMFTPFTFKTDITWIHVPLSITRPGFAVGKETRKEVEEFLTTIKGYSIFLNSPRGYKIPGFAYGRTCSRISLDIQWNSLDEYIGHMRGHYRYRLKKAMKKGKDLNFRYLDSNKEFDENLYNCYLSVNRKSQIKIETLGIEFFRSDVGKILVASYKGKDVGFVQIIENDKELIFAFVGIDYDYNRQFDVYLNLLIQMIDYTITNKFEILEMGQTAEDAKLRLGGKFSELRAQVRHSNPFMNWFIKRFIKFISYKEPKLNFNIFKTEDAI